MFALNDEQKMIKKAISEFSEKEIAPVASDNERNNKYPADIINKLAELGFMGHFVPEVYGGSGLDFLSYIISIEEISKACASTGIIVSAHNSLVCSPILEFGTEEQRNKYLPDLSNGTKLGCFALSEPESGSDAASIRTTSKKVDDYYILNGVKNWITNGAEADISIVFAVMDKSKKTRGLNAFIVDLHNGAVSIGKSEHKLGIKASSTTQILFENCKLSSKCLLGSEGDGFKIAMKTLDGGRIGVAAQALGIAQSRWLGRRSNVRGVAMNPVDHPHGGGEGRSSGGRHPVTPWGVPTKGHRTRKKSRSNKLIVKRRGQK